MMSGSKTSVYASFSRRVIAHLIDEGVVILLCGLLYLFNRALGSPVKYSALFDTHPVISFDSFMYYNFPALALLYLFIKLFLTYPYFALLESSPWQATFGKMAVGIKVTDLSGHRISFARASGRFFLKALHTPLLMLPYVLSFSDQKQPWHDYIAKTLVVRDDVLPAIYALPRVPSRWLFDWPGQSEGRSTGQIEDAPTGYVCMFCQYHASEKHAGCPKCGMAFGFMPVGALKSLQLIHGIIFTLVGSFALWEGVRMVIGEVRGEYGKIPWWSFAFVFAFGCLFAAGGISSLFRRSWLIRWLLLLLTSGRSGT